MLHVQNLNINLEDITSYIEKLPVKVAKEFKFYKQRDNLVDWVNAYFNDQSFDAEDIGNLD